MAALGSLGTTGLDTCHMMVHSQYHRPAESEHLREPQHHPLRSAQESYTLKGKFNMTRFPLQHSRQTENRQYRFETDVKKRPVSVKLDHRRSLRMESTVGASKGRTNSRKRREKRCGGNSPASMQALGNPKILS